MSPKRLIRLPHVIEIVDLKRSSIYKLIALGLFPPPIKPAGTRASLWSLEAVEAWISKQIDSAA